MRRVVTALLLALALCTASNAGGSSKPFPEGSVSAYFGPGQHPRLTITTANGVVSVLDVPQGVFLNVIGPEKANPGVAETKDFPRTFKGDITIRTRRKDEIGESESTAAREFMAKSPLEMSVKNASVLLEVVP